MHSELERVDSESKGGVTELECPDCGREMEVSLPISAEIAAITTAFADESDAESQKRDGQRAIQRPCPEGHHVTVIYDW